MKSQYHYVSCNIVKSVALCAPAARMFFVTAGVIEGNPKDTWSDYKPVLAIRSESVDRYSKKCGIGEWPEHPYSHEDFEAEGWQFTEHECKERCIIHDSDYGMIETDDELLKTEDTASKIVVLPWPFDEALDGAAIKNAVVDLLATLTPKKP